MPTIRSAVAPILALVAAATIYAPGAPAQVPDGWAVVCTYSTPSFSGVPGLFLVPLPPRTGNWIPVTGLPPELSTDGGLAFQQGGQAVSIRSDDGAVIVTTTVDTNAPNGGELALFVLHLSVNPNAVPATAAVVQTRRIALGSLVVPNSFDRSNPYNLGAALHRVLPDGRIVVAAADLVGPLPAGNMANHVLAIVDTAVTPAAFTLLRNPPIPRNVRLGGFDVDAAGEFAYYVLSTPNVGNAQVHRMQLSPAPVPPTPGLAQDCVIATFPGEASNGLVLDDDGSLYVAGYDLTTWTWFVRRLQVDGCNPAVVTTVGSTAVDPLLLAWGLELHRASGCFLAGSYYGLPVPPPNNVWRHTVALVDPNGGPGGAMTVTPVFPSSNGALGLQGIAVNHAIESYGAPTPGQNRYWFDNFPNAAGEPTVGHQGFGLTMSSAPDVTPPTPPMLSAMALALGRGATIVLGAELLVDPASAIFQLVAPGPAVPFSLPFSLPIPNLAALRGLTVTAQSLHLEATGNLATSRGLTLTVQ